MSKNSVHLIMKKYGPRYYAATIFFPAQIRHAVFVLYAWVRFPDNIVDSGDSTDKRKEDFSMWMNQWSTVESGGKGPYYMEEFFRISKKYNISREYQKSFLQAMQSDLGLVRVQSYKQLEQYMYGSATVVGLMMTQIFGVSSLEANKPAQDLAQAMQLTNFLRDVKEDKDLLNRIYLPAEELFLFDLSHDDIINERYDENFKNMMRFFMTRARELFSESESGIGLLPRYARFPVRLASRYYKSILDEIEKKDYNIYKHRIQFTRRKKITIFIKSLIF